MANVLNSLFGGGNKPAAAPVKAPSGDSGFADFAGVVDEPAPTPQSFPPVATNPFPGASLPAAATGRPYTKWYNVHERYTWADFRTEGIILACVAVVLVLHLIGARLNRSKARRWISAHAATLASEFALVGFSGAAVADQDAESMLREKSLFEFATYATGRANVAFVDVKLTLTKRFNPLAVLSEYILGFFFESFGAAAGDVCEAVLYPFDGKEALLVPGLPGAAEKSQKEGKSAYDGFVWAIVNKEVMKQVRDDRYDVSLTYTKDHAKLPSWLTVMSESAEITDTLLTPELIAAAEAAGDNFEYLIVSDQPVEKPKTIDETTPRKRIFLKYRLPSNDNYDKLVPIFQQLLRIPDLLVQTGRFRPEVLRKVKTVREAAIRQIQKAEEDEKAEERAAERERARKAKRDAELKALDAKAQKKYLEKEREKEMRKSTKKMTTRA
ncbi:DUF1682 domain-protein [Echria macrotheca]|uniref:DUF1682 domain-protein n=1 Tax=Echria macrotheca TaxID=438768 RepID=A0AAJ0B303_9PEZI|nr:DUF1682 domain-protein [Echria macrotheca]